MIPLIFYTTAGCHLCDEAYVLISSLQDQYHFSVTQQEIGDDDHLVEQYGIRIPVLRFPDDTELNWPFTQHDIIQQLARLN